MGLSIVKSIVDMMGGTIRLESEKGKGSRFTVEIPMQTADAITGEEKDVQKTPLKKSYSVVTLDDNEIVLNMIKDMYASVGVHCDTFSNVGDMMEAIRIRNYDFAIGNTALCLKPPGRYTLDRFSHQTSLEHRGHALGT